MFIRYQFYLGLSFITTYCHIKFLNQKGLNSHLFETNHFLYVYIVVTDDIQVLLNHNPNAMHLIVTQFSMGLENNGRKHYTCTKIKFVRLGLDVAEHTSTAIHQKRTISAANHSMMCCRREF